MHMYTYIILRKATQSGVQSIAAIEEVYGYKEQACGAQRLLYGMFPGQELLSKNVLHFTH